MEPIENELGPSPKNWGANFKMTAKIRENYSTSSLKSPKWAIDNTIFMKRKFPSWRVL